MALFPTTTWSNLNRLHRSSDGEVRLALSRLCETYWQPLYSYLRQSGHDPDGALDLVQSYFLHLIESEALRQVEPEKGRFRSFLIASLKNFVANQRRHQSALKRMPEGGWVSLDAEAAERRFLELARDDLNPEMVYERNWAIDLINRGVEMLRHDQSADAGQQAFDALAPYVLGAGQRRPYSIVAGELGLSEAAVKVRVSRLRKKLGRLLCQEVRSTVAGDGEVEGELRHLLGLWEAARA